jgi:hypothetical protein
MGAAGAAAAVEAADVALFGSDLSALAFAIRLGRAAGRIVTLNIAFAVGVKLAVLVAAAAGATSLWLSLFADVGASLAVTIHALSLLRFEADGGDGSSGDDYSVGQAIGAPMPAGLGALMKRAASALPWRTRSALGRYSGLGGGGGGGSGAFTRRGDESRHTSCDDGEDGHGKRHVHGAGCGAGCGHHHHKHDVESGLHEPLSPSSRGRRDGVELGAVVRSSSPPLAGSKGGGPAPPTVPPPAVFANFVLDD